VKKRRRREEGEEEEENRGDHRGFSSGVIPIKVCESLVWVYPFPPHTKLVFMILEEIGFVVEVVEVVSCC